MFGGYVFSNSLINRLFQFQAWSTVWLFSLLLLFTVSPFFSPTPWFLPSVGKSQAFFRMGLVKSLGSFLIVSLAPSAERLMAGMKSCQWALMNAEFCCCALKSLLSWQGDNGKQILSITQQLNIWNALKYAAYIYSTGKFCPLPLEGQWILNVDILYQQTGSKSLHVTLYHFCLQLRASEVTKCWYWSCVGKVKSEVWVFLNKTQKSEGIESNFSAWWAYWWILCCWKPLH